MASVVQPASISKSLNPSKGTQGMPIAGSQFLQDLAYDAANQQLTVTMKNGAQYQYFNVPQHVMDEFVKNPSKGSVYAKLVKGAFKSSRTVDKSIGPAVPKRVKT